MNYLLTNKSVLSCPPADRNFLLKERYSPAVLFAKSGRLCYNDFNKLVFRFFVDFCFFSVGEKQQQICFTGLKVPFRVILTTGLSPYSYSVFTERIFAMRKLIATVLSFCIVILCIPNLSTSAAYAPDFTVSSESALLVSMDSGKVIYEKDADKKLYPASLTKIMTCLLVLENIPEAELESTLITGKQYIFDELYLKGASHANIMANEQVRVIDLLYATMLRSACEAASMLADYVGNGGDDSIADADNIPRFVSMMNAKAKELGAVNTVFKNAHGLHEDEQVTTAHDLYLILKYAIEKYPLFLKIATTVQYTMPVTNKHSQTRTISHTNPMLFKSNSNYYAYAKGIKTGTTTESGRNLISMAEYNNSGYLLITMKAPYKYDTGEIISDNLACMDHKNIYKWVFGSFEQKTILTTSTVAAQAPIQLGKDKDTLLLVPKEDIVALLPKHVDVSSVQKVAHINESIFAPIKKGQVLGTMDLKLADEVIASVELVASDAVERSSVAYLLYSVKSFFTSSYFKWALVIIAVFLLIYVTLIILYNNKKKKRKRVISRRKL